jgi:CubicO group peptidase (beta-lactamase class C family)
LTGEITVHGTYAPKFAGVAEAFASNFEEGETQEIGASFAATIDGEMVVDIWAGHADIAKTRPWEQDTIVNVWSTTKSLVITCIHMLVDRGLLDLEAPVSRYWPEFAQGGKEDMPVMWLLTHQSALPRLIGDMLPVEACYDWEAMIEKLAQQEPLWEPGTQSGYHSVTFGFLVGEVIRRVSGKSIGTFLREEVAEPLGADFHIGLPEEHDGRVAELLTPPPRPPSPNRPSINPEMPLIAGNTLEWRRAEIPAANGHGNARSVARVMSALACGGEVDGVRLLSAEAIDNAIQEQSYGKDLTLNVPFRLGAGFMLVSNERPFGPNPRTFGHSGVGGSLGVADLDARMSWSYTMNRLVMRADDTRASRISKALHSALA